MSVLLLLFFDFILAHLSIIGKTFSIPMLRRSSVVRGRPSSVNNEQIFLIRTRLTKCCLGHPWVGGTKVWVT